MRWLAFILTILAGIILGLGSARVSVNTLAERLSRHIGVWTFVPRIGAADLDPYQRARMFLEGFLPLADGEGFSLRAERDSTGQRLDATCTYRLEGTMPAARYWSVTVTDRNGRLIPNLAERHGFTSAELIYPHGRPVRIMLSPQAQPGNWLPLAGEGPIAITLRFYDTPLSASASVLDAKHVPDLVRMECTS